MAYCLQPSALMHEKGWLRVAALVVGTALVGCAAEDSEDLTCDGERCDLSGDVCTDEPSPNVIREHDGVDDVDKAGKVIAMLSTAKGTDRHTYEVPVSNTALGELRPWVRLTGLTESYRKRSTAICVGFVTADGPQRFWVEEEWWFGEYQVQEPEYVDWYMTVNGVDIPAHCTDLHKDESRGGENGTAVQEQYVQLELDRIRNFVDGDEGTMYIEVSAAPTTPEPVICRDYTLEFGGGNPPSSDDQ